mmetsp:Transcript_41724/g.138316  ORF Transcript_41724/g.138316 Transcript_41724/m.138316 type:complete len:256 (-) Transcript_41724:291-1058(-)
MAAAAVAPLARDGRLAGRGTLSAARGAVSRHVRRAARRGALQGGGPEVRHHAARAARALPLRVLRKLQRVGVAVWDAAPRAPPMLGAAGGAGGGHRGEGHRPREQGPVRLALRRLDLVPKEHGGRPAEPRPHARGCQPAQGLPAAAAVLRRRRARRRVALVHVAARAAHAAPVLLLRPQRGALRHREALRGAVWAALRQRRRRQGQRQAQGGQADLRGAERVAARARGGAERQRPPPLRRGRRHLPREAALVRHP